MGDESVDHELGSHAFFSTLSLRSVVAAMAFFGQALVVGNKSRGASCSDRSAGCRILRHGPRSLDYEDSSRAQIRRQRQDRELPGKDGTVYLSIPGENAGVGKITVHVRNRTMEYSAVITREELPTGSGLKGAWMPW